jgi:hypothetical protein
MLHLGGKAAASHEKGEENESQIFLGFPDKGNAGLRRRSKLIS